ncbi:MAG TPA: hypothetical protein PKO06_12690 [Candidatus Ozemobacteraceae bacterium]|nr:hypothetical protein [Candidatus Ozemobacteraceae bacterium]
MKILSAIIDYIDDRLNPIVVKEFRQAVQGRFVSSVLILFLLVQLAAIALTIIDRSYVHQSFQAGRDAFITLMVLLMITTMVIIPINSGIRIAGERSDINLDLLFITTIKPSAIVRGKLFASFGLALLIYSACAPFMTFTYLLRGIDLPSIFLVLLVSLFAVLVNLQIALFLGCLPASNIFKYLLLPVGLIFFFQNFGITMALVSDILRYGIGGRFNMMDFFMGATCVLMLVFMMFTMTSTILTPPASNRAFPVRLSLTLSWLIIGVAVFLYSSMTGYSGGIDAWAVMSIVALALSFLAAVSERDDPGIRVRRAIPEGRIKWLLSFLFYSGSANGFAWSVVMIFLTVVGGFFASEMIGSGRFLNPYSGSDTFIEMMGFVAYCYCFALSSMLLQRTLLSNMFDRSVTWVIALFLAAIGGTVGPLVGYVFFQSDGYAWMLLNPTMIADRGHRDLVALFLIPWTLISTLMALPWFSRQVAQFKPFNPETDRVRNRRVVAVFEDVLPT